MQKNNLCKTIFSARGRVSNFARQIYVHLHERGCELGGHLQKTKKTFSTKPKQPKNF